MLTDAELLSLPESIRAKVEAVALRLNSADARIRNLEDKIRLLLILKYGPSSEKLKDAQLDLLESEPGVTPREVEQEAARPEGEKQAAEKINRRRPQRGAFTLPADLQRSKEAGPNIAAILSVVETCHRLKISVREYLLDVLPKLATGKTADAASLTPIAWKAARSQPGK